VQIRLVGEDGNDAAIGEPGELLVRSAGDDPRATSSPAT
jgi:non-ribosomal peptide synthetase component E (peptide arylation enzyme)